MIKRILPFFIVKENSFVSFTFHINFHSILHSNYFIHNLHTLYCIFAIIFIHKFSTIWKFSRGFSFYQSQTIQWKWIGKLFSVQSWERKKNNFILPSNTRKFFVWLRLIQSLDTIVYVSGFSVFMRELSSQGKLREYLCFCCSTTTNSWN